MNYGALAFGLAYLALLALAIVWLVKDRMK